MILGAIPGATPDKWVERWRQRFPQVRLTVEYDDDGAADGSDQLNRLAQGQVDIAYLRLRADTDVNDDRFHRVWLYEEQPVVCTAEEHWIAAAETSVTWEDLAEENFLNPDQMLEPDQRQEGPKTGTQLAQAERIAVEVAASGAGVVLLPQSVARAISRKDTVTRVVEDAPGWRTGLVWLRERDGEEIQEFVGLARGRKAGSGRSELNAVDQQKPKDQGKKTGSAAARTGSKASGKSRAGTAAGSSKRGGKPTNPRSGKPKLSSRRKPKGRRR